MATPEATATNMETEQDLESPQGDQQKQQGEGSDETGHKPKASEEMTSEESGQ